jgi:integrase
MTGIPELANLRYVELPKADVTIEQLIKTYEDQNPSTPKTKIRAIKAMRNLAKMIDARIVNDLTQEAMLAYRQSVETSSTITSAGTKVWQYGQIKGMLAFGLKCGLDQKQLRTALDNCKILWTSSPPAPVNPKPISREEFHALLKAAAKSQWRAWLLVGLNCALSIREVCDLEWESIDLERGVYATIRNKTKAKRIPRAATLWDETVEALRGLPGGGSYVFTSRHGTRFKSTNTRDRYFEELRIKAGIKNRVTFSSLKDSSYTIACQAGNDERLARVLAGHRSPGMLDNYVLRNPEMVRPACEAVYVAFGPFP